MINNDISIGVAIIIDYSLPLLKDSSVQIGIRLREVLKKKEKEKRILNEKANEILKQINDVIMKMIENENDEHGQILK